MQAEHNVEKFVVMGDAHLLQSYMGVYDPILDFENVFQKIMKLSPDFIGEKNFHYSGDSWETLGSTDVYFMNTRYEAEYYDEKLLEADIGNILEGTKRRRKGKKPKPSILLCHEWFAKEGVTYPRELLEKLLEKFSWVLNGHMHFYSKNYLNCNNLVCLPSLLPSRVLVPPKKGERPKPTRR